MGRKSKDWTPYEVTTPGLILIGFVACLIGYGIISVLVTPNTVVTSSSLSVESSESQSSGTCCRGIEHLELWGPVLRSGTELKLNTSKQCCQACKDTCKYDGHCSCNAWVFCGDKNACKAQFGECWLKKQTDSMFPSVRDSGSSVMWTSGIIFGQAQGIVAMKTNLGIIHIQLLPECAPHSVEFILEILKLKYCGSCQIYRAEPRGELWDDEGNHIKGTRFGPPYALIQGTLDAEGTVPDIPKENLSPIRRGSVAWVDSGPEFFISLANHDEWVGKYTVFGSVLPESMGIVENIASLPTKTDTWNNIVVSVLEKHVPISIRSKETKSN